MVWRNHEDESRRFSNLPKLSSFSGEDGKNILVQFHARTLIFKWRYFCGCLDLEGDIVGETFELLHIRMSVYLDGLWRTVGQQQFWIEGDEARWCNAFILNKNFVTGFSTIDGCNIYTNPVSEVLLAKNHGTYTHTQQFLSLIRTLVVPLALTDSCIFTVPINK